MPMDKKRDKRTKKISSSKGELSVIPLGGLGEIGKNLTVFRYDNDIIIVDCGLKFPEEDMLGIDFVIPDVQYLIENKDKILGIFITHGHEDHIGALPFILPRLDVPLYCSRLAAGMIANKMEDARTNYKPKYREIFPGDIIEAGAFSVEFIPVCHSIPDALALSIHTPMGMIVHTGDFKLDPTPIDGVGTDYSSFAALGKEGVMLMLSDSTNIEKDGITPSEKTVGQTFERLFRIHKDRRIVIATFSSNLHRSQQVINAAGRFNRKVVLAGRSMIKNVELAIDLGYINVPEGLIITSQEADQMPGNRVVILTTGSQGEPFSGLVMMSRGTHRTVKLGPKDLVIISATPIPGNEKLVSHTVNRLFACGCEVIYERGEKIHVSGHAARDELTIMLSMLKPRYFIPVHGEYRHLVRHAQLAREMGVASKNVFVMQNGDVLKFKGKSNASVEGRVQAGAVLVDGIALGEFEGGLLRERRELSENGIVAISITLDSKSRLTAPIQIQTKGSVFSTEDGSTFRELENAVKMGLEQFARTPGAKPETLPTEIRKRIRDVFGKLSRNYPVIVPLITFVE
ncbi:MAG: ribonuclease J [Synergistaceae bacterium]|jgi:ribonuclease J|nr:ribonuclease J [Synergistaceae bacterium]PKL04978.1 MAG: ribonuclease J [Synergistetes bacterium HGW-Synergistetes-1]MBP9559045.1 ribonuclease J [Synergistaceae bacterium]MBP9975139.1 ribonuclease J [Synergistaceae bacterium]MCE5183119.1 ribonuclease J [Synergistaceae bacterium]